MRAIVDLAYRSAYRVGFALALLVWRTRRPTHNGALVAIHVGDELLLVRQSYRGALSLPGGGVASGETPLEAARRELVEELHLDIRPGQLREVHTETGLWDGRDDTVTFFEAVLEQAPALRIDGREIVEARLVPRARLGALRLTGPARAYVNWAAARS